MAAKGRDLAGLGTMAKPTLATAPHRIPVSTLRRSISFIGFLLQLDLAKTSLLLYELRGHAVGDEPCMTRLTTMAAMPASTALACGDVSTSMIGFDPCACS